MDLDRSQNWTGNLCQFYHTFYSDASFRVNKNVFSLEAQTLTNVTYLNLRHFIVCLLKVLGISDLQHNLKLAHYWEAETCGSNICDSSFF
jgi:hypothetical protein